MKTHLIVPTLNAAADWRCFTPALLACVSPEQVLIVDSESTDGTVDLARAAGFRVHSIARSEFNHGRTRQVAAEMLPNADLLVYMTQDAILASPTAIAALTAVMKDETIAAAYGRQLPRPSAGPIEAHARLFNYPATSHTRDLSSRQRFGIKSIFLSNSFAVYRRSALMQAGGFRTDLIFGEDTTMAAKLLLAGGRIAYVADALVYHSHPYTCLQEFKRYFDVGVLHVREGRLLEQFGSAPGEGKRFVLSELRFLWEVNPMQIPQALVRTGLKLLGYRLGRLESYLPAGLKQRISMNQAFWVNRG